MYNKGGWNDLENLKNAIKMSDEDRWELEFASELRRYEVAEINFFKGMFDLIVSGKKNDSKRQELLQDYIKTKRRGQDYFCKYFED